MGIYEQYKKSAQTSPRPVSPGLARHAPKGAEVMELPACKKGVGLFRALPFLGGSFALDPGNESGEIMS
jgi:hypothetical protein